MMRIIFILVFIFCPFIILGQNNEWSYFSSNQRVNAITSNKDFLWIGTDIGPVLMNKLSGNKKHFFSCNCKIPTNNINDCKVDNLGNVWFATMFGLTKFDGINWTTYNSSNSDLPGDWLSSLEFDSEGNLWIGTYYGALIKYHDGTWDVFYLPTYAYIWDICIESNGNIWLAANSEGLFLFSNNIFTSYKTSNSEIPSDWVLAVEVDSKGNKWVGTLGGLAKFDNNIWKVYNSSNSSLPYDWVKTISIDKQDNIWIGTWFGLAVLSGLNWTVYNSSNSGVPGDEITKILFDANNVTWIGTDNGLAKFTNNSWTSYKLNNDNFGTGWITDIKSDSSNNIWVGSWNGLSKFTGSDWLLFNTSNSGLRSNSINSITIMNNDKWISTGLGLSKFDDFNWITYTTSNSGLPDNNIHCVAIDSNGNVWIGTDGGLTKFDGANWENFNTFNSSLPVNQISKISINNNGEIWMATSQPSNLIIHFIDRNNIVVYDNETTGIPAMSGVSINGIAFDNSNNKWFAHNFGLTKFDNSNWTTVSSYSFFSLNIDKNGILWGGSGFDLAKYDGVSVNLVSTGLDEAIISTTIDSKNNIWIGTEHTSLGTYHEGGVNADINGTVVDYTGHILTKGTAYLFNNTKLYGGYDTVSITSIENGKYSFKNIANCGYTIFTTPDSSFQHLLPSYLGDTILWSGSDTLLVRGDVIGGNIKDYERPPLMNGNTIIAGEVISNLWPGTKKRDPIDNVGIVITKKSPAGKNSSSKNQLVGYTTTDILGTFKIESIEEGVYSIYVDYPGIPMDIRNNANIIVISKKNDTIKVVAEVNPDIILMKGNFIDNIDQTINISMVLKVYPNPIITSATIIYPDFIGIPYDFILSDLKGNQIKIINNIKTASFKFERENLPAGIYLIRLSGKDKYFGKLIIN